MKSLARTLRQQATDAERRLWKHVRAHRMAGYKFWRQVVIEPYIVDFVCLEARLIVEADGGQHLEQLEDDLKRSVYLESLGYKVIRCWNHEILGDTYSVLERIYGYLSVRAIYQVALLLQQVFEPIHGLLAIVDKYYTHPFGSISIAGIYPCNPSFKFTQQFHFWWDVKMHNDSCTYAQRLIGFNEYATFAHIEN